MRIVVIGAAGRTGQQVVREARARGHRVIAASRSAPEVTWPSGVTPVRMDVTEGEAVARVLEGAEAVVFAVGIGASREPTTIYSAGVRNVLAALGEAESRHRLSVISAVPAAPSSELTRMQRIVGRVLAVFFGASYRDLRRMEELLVASGAGWVCLRPPRLIDGPARGSYRIDTRAPGSTIARADLAAALLDVLDEPRYDRRRLFVAN